MSTQKYNSRITSDLERSAEELDDELTAYNQEIDRLDIDIPRLEAAGEVEKVEEKQFERNVLKKLRTSLIMRINRIYAAKARIV